MKMPGFTGHASLYYAQETYRSSDDGTAEGERLTVLPQLGFGGGGITGPADGEEYCYVCTAWIRVPCGISVA